MIRFDKVMSLIICIVIMALIIPKNNILLFTISIALIFFISVLSGFISKPKEHLVSIEKIINRGDYLKLYFIQTIILILYFVFLKAVSSLIPYSYREIGIYLIVFILLSKDILYRSLSFRICQISYQYSQKSIYIFIMLTNLLYTAVIIFALVSNLYKSIFTLDRGQYIVLVLFLLILIDQFYLFLVDKQKTLFQIFFHYNLVHN